MTEDDILSMIIMGKTPKNNKTDMYIGLDLGTSGLKAVLIDDAQAILAEATAPLKVARLAQGWSEQAPSSWLDAADAVMQSLAGQV